MTRPEPFNPIAPAHQRSSSSHWICGILCSVLLSTPAIALELTIHLIEKKNLSLDGTIVEVAGSSNFQASQNDQIINQLDKEFNPLISIVPKGSKILLMNDDSFKHHVYSLSEGNQFDIPLFSKPSQKEVTLEHHGIVKMGCNIHDWMIAYIYVSENDLIKEVSESPVTFSGLSAGEYQVRVWNPRFRNTKRIIRHDLILMDGQSSEITINLKLRKSIHRNKKPTTSSGTGYGLDAYGSGS